MHFMQKSFSKPNCWLFDYITILYHLLRLLSANDVW